MSLTNLIARLLRLEQVATDNEPIKPGLILFANGSEPTPEQQAQIIEAEANGQKVIVFTVKDASLKGAALEKS
jgi:hypothetical protein